jgi:hypothetical protein
MRGVLILVAARARRRPGRWLLPALGLALTVAFLATVLSLGPIAGTQAARSVLSGLSSQDLAVQVTWEGPVTPVARATALHTFQALHLAPPTYVLLMSPVRLDGVIVRPAAITPLSGWSDHAAPGRCRPVYCPVLSAGALPRSVFAAPGVRLVVVGHAQLRSAAPLGFVPGQASAGEPPVLLTGDAAGLEGNSELSGVYRTHSWLSLLSTRGLAGWQLAGLEHRLQAAQAALLAASPQFSFSAPFTALDAARAQASAAPRRLLLAGGGAAAALLLFVVLAAGGLRRDQTNELARLRVAGARPLHCLALVAGEAAWLCALAVAAGAALATLAIAVLAPADGVPVTAGLTHSLLTPGGLLWLGGGWLAAFLLLTLLLMAPSSHVADVVALVAAGALALALARPSGGGDALSVLLAPLACLAAGVLVFRATGALLEVAERVLHRGPVLARLAVVGLARDATGPALAIAVIAVSTGLGGFALAYRATLVRGSADQAANQVPLDALVAPTPDFTTPLELASLARWSRLAHGAALPVRRTYASFVSGGASVTVPALGVPAAALSHLRGWRRSDGSAPMNVLARRLPLAAPVRVPGPLLPAGTRQLELAVHSMWLAVTVTADLRSPTGTVTRVPLGVGFGARSTLRAAVPGGRWELEALELSEPTGLEITNGHQNGENPAAATQAALPLALGRVAMLDSRGRGLLSVSLGAWRGVGALTAGPGSTGASGESAGPFRDAGTRYVEGPPSGIGTAAGPGSGPGGRGPYAASRTAPYATSRTAPYATSRTAPYVTPRPGPFATAPNGPVPSGAWTPVRFDASGLPGVLRPVQPTDMLPVPVLADGQTAAAAARGGRLALTVDGLPVSARVVGVLRRFPTVASGSAGFVIADGPTLAAALDAQLPGQGRPDELWISSRSLGGLRAALARGQLAELTTSFRSDIQRRLAHAPIGRALLGTLAAAAGVAGLLAILGLLVTLVGTLRNPRIESDLAGQGAGPRWLRAELRLRLGVAAVTGVGAGTLVALLLTPLALSGAQAASTLEAPQPPLVTVTPGAALAAWALGAAAALVLAGWLATRALARERSR